MNGKIVTIQWVNNHPQPMFFRGQLLDADRGYRVLECRDFRTRKLVEAWAKMVSANNNAPIRKQSGNELSEYDFNGLNF